MTSDRPFSRDVNGDGYVLRLGKDERELLSRLLGELRELLTEPDEPAMVRRLFPVVHPEHAEREAEYQRLMRDELVTSRVAGIEVVEAVLARRGRSVTIREDEMAAFVRSVNAVRLVLGTLLDVGEDDDRDRPELARSSEYHLYAYLSWILDAAIRASDSEPG